MALYEEFEIDEEIIAPPNLRGKFGCRLPWHKMKPGMSFLIPCETLREYQAIMSNLSRIRKNMQYKVEFKGFEFMARRVEGGVRVWRIK